jgi:hypothetical protein
MALLIFFMCLSFRQQHEAIVKHAQNILDTKQVREQFARHFNCKADVYEVGFESGTGLDPDSIGSVLRIRSRKVKVASKNTKMKKIHVRKTAMWRTLLWFFRQILLLKFFSS